MREELSHFRWRRRCGRWCWAYSRALNNVDQWKSTTSVLAPKATNERRAFSFQVTEEVRKMMLSIFASIKHCRPMTKHHIYANQWDTSFLISGDRGGAEDDAEHICEHGGGAGQVPGSLREGGLLQLHVQLCPPLLACPASKLYFKICLFCCCKLLSSQSFSIWKVIFETSVPDPDPDSPDLHVFGPPRSGSGSISQRYGSGSGSFYLQAKTVRKTLIPTVLWLLLDFLSLKMM